MLPISVIVVFSTLQFKPENLAKSSKICFKFFNELYSALVATVVSSANAFVLSVFRLFSFLK